MYINYRISFHPRPHLCQKFIPGERKPRHAKISVTRKVMAIWQPLPTSTDRSITDEGARNTSPCTSFQPNSSCASSEDSAWTVRGVEVSAAVWFV